MKSFLLISNIVSLTFGMETIRTCLGLKTIGYKELVKKRDGSPPRYKYNIFDPNKTYLGQITYTPYTKELINESITIRETPKVNFNYAEGANIDTVANIITAWNPKLAQQMPFSSASKQ